MADYERTILEFYQLPTPYPTEWPAEKEEGEASDEDEGDIKLQRRKSRYQALERAVSRRGSAVPGSEGGAGGVGNLVSKDEPDPLGSSYSVVRTLKHLGLPLQDDLRLRRFGDNITYNLKLMDLKRQPFLTLLDDVLARSLLVSNALHCRYPKSPSRLRCPVTIHRSKVRIAQGLGRKQLREIRESQGHN